MYRKNVLNFNRHLKIVFFFGGGGDVKIGGQHLQFSSYEFSLRSFNEQSFQYYMSKNEDVYH